MFKSHLPIPTGTFTVFSEEFLLPSKTEGNDLLVKCWFPVEKHQTKHQKKHPSLPEDYLPSFAKVAAHVPVFLARMLAHCETNSYIAAEPNFNTYEKKSIPVLLFSHGLFGTPHLYSAIAEEAASRGFFAISPFHTDGSAFEVRYPSGKNKEFLQTTATGDELRELRRKQLHTRVSNLKQIIDYLEELQKDTEETNNMQKIIPYLDLSKIVAAGHSFGGATVFQASVMDSRIISACAHDGWFFPLFSIADPISPIDQNKKFLFLDSDYWQTEENRTHRKEFLQHLFKDHKTEFLPLLHVVPKTSHQNFCDLAAMLPSFGKLLKLISREIEPVATLGTINAVTMNFLQKGISPESASELKL